MDRRALYDRVVEDKTLVLDGGDCKVSVYIGPSAHPRPKIDKKVTLIHSDMTGILRSDTELKVYGDFSDPDTLTAHMKEMDYCDEP